MGVTRVIREQLTPAHQVFIAEMGARHVGDIKELVELVHPSMGLITSSGRSIWTRSERLSACAIRNMS